MLNNNKNNKNNDFEFIDYDFYAMIDLSWFAKNKNNNDYAFKIDIGCVDVYSKFMLTHNQYNRLIKNLNKVNPLNSNDTKFKQDLDYQYASYLDNKIEI